MTVWALLLLVPGEIPTIAAREFPPALQEKAILATVQIRNPTHETQGSGALIGKDRNFFYVLTANHVVDRPDGLEVQTYSAASYPRVQTVYRSVRVVARGKGPADLALLRVPTGDAPPALLPLCPPGLLGPAAKSLTVLSVGCGGEQPPTCQSDRAVKKQARLRGGEPAWYWEVQKDPERGRSGGPQ
jgi:hypothetical protein